MSAQPFTPTPFATPVVAPLATSITRAASYISVSEYRFAPTAVATADLVPGSNNQAADSAASLAEVIARASSWINQICFHTPDGSLVASVTTESAWVKTKDDGSIPLVCNYKPILDVQGIALGPTPSQLTSLNATDAQGVWIENKIIWITPVPLSLGPFPAFSPGYSYDGRTFAVWTYTNGFPHTTLAANAAVGSTSISVNPSTPGGTSVSGVYPGTQLVIRDMSVSPAAVETVVVQSVNGLTLNLTAGLKYAHSVPAAPDAIMVTAVPWAVQQACISLTSMLIKLRGSRAHVLPGTAGTKAGKQALSQAGALEDYEIACRLLKPYMTVFMAH